MIRRRPIYVIVGNGPNWRGWTAFGIGLLGFITLTALGWPILLNLALSALVGAGIYKAGR